MRLSLRLKGTALHEGRNFAVSLPLLPEEITHMGTRVSQRGRHCSHPFTETVRRVLPATMLPDIQGRVRTFLPIPKAWTGRLPDEDNYNI